MKQPRGKKQKTVLPLCNNPLVCLPEHVIDSILVRLPIKDAVKTSLLSRYWRHRWKAIPDLVFNHNSFPRLFAPRVSAASREAICGRFVSTMLLLHRGDVIRKFELSPVPLRNASCWVLESWMAKLAASGVKQLTLHFDPYQRRLTSLESKHLKDLTINIDLFQKEARLHQVHRMIFCCHNLTSLELSDCVFKLPAEFGGFPYLNSLTLRRVVIGTSDLGRLVSCCRMLKQLYLRMTGQPDSANVMMSAPNLNHLEIYFKNEPGEMFLDAPMLSHASFNFAGRPDKHINLNHLLGKSKNLEKLKVTGAEFTGNVPLRFGGLKSLHLQLNSNFLRHPEFAMHLATISPALEKLQVVEGYSQCHSSHVANFPNERKPVENLSHLKTFEFQTLVWSIDHLESMVTFINFVLEYSPSLEQVWWLSSYQEKPKLEDLLSVKRISTDAIDHLLTKGTKFIFGSKVMSKASSSIQ